MKKHLTCQHPKIRGFTLTELLMVLLILGVVATFTIPKVLAAQQNTKNLAIARESMAAIAQAYELYKLEHAASAATHPTDLLPYLNYVKKMTSGSIDHVPGQADLSCAGVPCYVLHNGSALQTYDNFHFGEEDGEHYVHFILDPDGQYSGSTGGSGKSIVIDLYYNGRINFSVDRVSPAQTYKQGVAKNWGPDPTPAWYDP